MQRATAQACATHRRKRHTERHEGVRALRECAGSQVAAGCVNLGAMPFDGEGVLKDETLGAAQANRLFHRNCDKGNIVGCAMLGKDLVDGIGTSADRVRGAALLQRVCEGHVAEACEKLAAMVRR